MKAHAVVISLALLVSLSVLSAVKGQESGSHPGFTLSGRVTDYTGNPRRGQLHAFRLAVQDGQLKRYASCTTESDTDGQYRCDGLEAGSYILQILLYPKSAKDDSPPSKDPVSIVYYPGVTDLEAAETIMLGNVKQTLSDITVPQSATFKISGSLQGVPSNADLRLETIGRDIRLDTEIHLLRNSQKQTFHADHVPNGRYLISAVWRNSRAPQRMVATIAVRNANLENIALHKELLIAFHGTVIGNSSDDINALLLYRKDNLFPKKIIQVKQGKFTVSPVPEGEYYFSLPVHSRGFISEIDRGGTPTEGSQILVSDGTSAANIQVMITAPGSTIVGSVPSSIDPHDLLHVIAVNQADEHIFTSVADARGKFSLTGLVPGEYTLFAWPASEDPPYRNPEVLQRLAKYGTTANVDKDAQTAVGNLPLTNPSTL